MEPDTKQRGRPRKMIPEPTTDAELDYITMYKHYTALKKAQHAYYQRNKDKFAEARKSKIRERTGEEPRLGRPKKKNDCDEIS